VDATERITFQSVLNYELQFVVKYLQAFDDDTFSNFSSDTPDFHPDAEPDLDAEQCFDLLQQYNSLPPLSLSFSRLLILL
jgi:hypothetical protein